MDWALAIETNRLVLLRLLMGLFAKADFSPGSNAESPTLPRHVRRAILLVLRPAESALRRLIAIRAREISVPAHVPRLPTPKAAPRRITALQKQLSTLGGRARVEAKRRAAALAAQDAVRPLPAFQLFDRWNAPHQRRPKAKVRFRSFDEIDGYPVTADVPAFLPDDPIPAMAIFKRMDAMHHALDDVPAQATRLAIALERRRYAAREGEMRGALRTGSPPGYRRKHIHEVDDILRRCHALAQLRDDLAWKQTYLQRREPMPPDKA
jgi:hypothetical protein